MTEHRIGLADAIRHVVNVAGATHVEIRLTADEAIKLARAVEFAGELIGGRPVGVVVGAVDQAGHNRT